ncbi:NAD(+)--dinitrogen-reductase ADP-D-ribosyltransferase [Caenispirillum salinarum]|uniref:NAD(+)--dinitrogen-reductase ADP-D-ribosyltransferase n=1 Tax=Caenispirillum salinarum TaxID=859058 RepID=UPI00384FF1E0
MTIAARASTAPPPPAVGHSTNLVGVPTPLLASRAYNEHPVPLPIAGVREMNRSFFTMLDDSPTLADAAEAFHKYMAAVFDLEPEQHEKARRSDGGVRRFRSSYLRLFKGWGYDNNSPEGAVLKGWVESRFGLFPTFHKGPIPAMGCKAWADYISEKMSSRFHNNSIYVQLDIMYGFCQWALERFIAPGESHLTLWRGVNDYDEHQMVERLDKRRVVIRMNNLVSFTSEREIADCFGDNILEARVPAAKVVFFSRLLPVHPLKGEDEFLVIGGDYAVNVSYF